MRFTTFYIALIFILPLLAGCAEDNPFGTVYVEGTVTLDGTPIQEVSVTFIPVDGELSAGGITDINGKFTLTTGGAPSGSGAKPGTYNVAFSKIEVEGAGLSEEEYMAKYRGGTPPVIYHIPQKYENPAASGIEPITVGADKANNKFTFALTSQ